jgi:type IV pilus assembly protein PilV
VSIKTREKNMKKKQSGFTLIEVMIALVILAAGLLALMTMQIVSIKANAFSSEMTYAAMVGQGELEKVRNMNYDDVKAVDTATYSLDPTLDATLDPTLAKGVNYTIERQVQNDIPTTDMKTVTLIVTWYGKPAGSADLATPTVLFTTQFSTVIKRY